MERLTCALVGNNFFNQKEQILILKNSKSTKSEIQNFPVH